MTYLTPEQIYPLIRALCFAGVAGLTLVGAVLAAAARRLVYSVCGLALSSVGLAGLYVYLSSPFLALMQILIYVGAVCIVILFALMLADTQDQPTSRARAVLAGLASFLVAGMLAIALILLVSRTAWMTPAETVNAGSVQDLGRALLHRFGFAFELISAVLLLAILGALVVARTSRETSRN
ncbi:MAG: NADH-quinone oxidoreductase subunit J [Kiritimatiellia bacterium]